MCSTMFLLCTDCVVFSFKTYNHDPISTYKEVLNTMAQQTYSVHGTNYLYLN